MAVIVSFVSWEQLNNIRRYFLFTTVRSILHAKTRNISGVLVYVMINASRYCTIHQLYNDSTYKLD